MTTTLDVRRVRAPNGMVKKALWLSGVRPADAMSAAAALNPDASSTWTIRTLALEETPDATIAPEVVTR